MIAPLTLLVCITPLVVPTKIRMATEQSVNQPRIPIVATAVSRPSTQIDPSLISLDIATHPVTLMTSDRGRSDAEVLYSNLSEFSRVPVLGDGTAAREALRFLEWLPMGVPLPHALEASDGTVILNWTTPEIYVDIDFSGDATYSIYTRRRSSASGDGEDNIPLGDKPTPRAAELLLPLSHRFSVWGLAKIA